MHKIHSSSAFTIFYPTSTQANQIIHLVCIPALFWSWCVALCCTAASALPLGLQDLLPPNLTRRVVETGLLLPQTPPVPTLAPNASYEALPPASGAALTPRTRSLRLSVPLFTPGLALWAMYAVYYAFLDPVAGSLIGLIYLAIYCSAASCAACRTRRLLAANPSLHTQRAKLEAPPPPTHPLPRFAAQGSGALGLSALGFAGVVQFLGWAAQLGPGHAFFERRKPALADSLAQAFLLGPLFIWFEVFFFFGYRPALQREVQRLVDKQLAAWGVKKKGKQPGRGRQQQQRKKGAAGDGDDDAAAAKAAEYKREMLRRIAEEARAKAEQEGDAPRRGSNRRVRSKSPPQRRQSKK